MTFVETFLEVHREDGDACKEPLVIEQLGCKVGVAPKRSILPCSFTLVLSLVEPSPELCLGMNRLPKCTLLPRSGFPLWQAEARAACGALAGEVLLLVSSVASQTQSVEGCWVGTNG